MTVPAIAEHDRDERGVWLNGKLVAVSGRGMQEDRAEWHLWNWQQWMHRGEHRIGYPSKASGGILGYRTTFDFDAEYERTCVVLARAVDVVIDALPGTYRTAVHAQLLGGPWRLPDIALGICYRHSVRLVARSLDAKGIV